jgi:dihydroneopterin aldolase / 2-amino-4-hydroxy-6-hydroxymethyldihydropteridine diphosphokinase
MNDEILIKDLLLRTFVGINQEEREKRQDVLINITLYADTRAAGLSDEIDDAVNYRTITKHIIRMVEASRFYLVERLVAEIVSLCLLDARVEAARVRVEKPGALRFARSVGVEVVRTRSELAREPSQVFLTLGSNIDPATNLRAAVGRLRKQRELSVIAVSPVYRTAPVGKVDQDDFLNVAVLVRTALSPDELKTGVLEPIEEVMGRVRTGDKNAPRTIDLDIALHGYEVLEVGSRHIPDPDIQRYPHVAIPLADLAPYYVHPETGETLEEIAGHLSKVGIERVDELVL